MATVLAETMVQDFQCVQASVHLLDEEHTLLRIVQRGREDVAPPAHLSLNDGFPGRVVATLLAHPDLAAVDLEPETDLNLVMQGINMACPLVAGGRVLGVLHTVMPDTLARVYLYNRAPMTLAHHAAVAFYAADKKTGLNGSGKEGS